MRKIKLTVPPEENGLRADLFVARRVKRCSRTTVQASFDAGTLLVNQEAVRSSFKLKPGDEVTGTLSMPAYTKAPAAEDIPLTVVHEDKHFMVINKPAGLVVHPGAGCHSGTLVNALVHRFGKQGLSGTGGTDRPGIVHRLDKETSGLLLIARTNAAHLALSAMFKERTIHKTYRAIVWGEAAVSGDIDRPIGRSRTDRRKMTVVGDGREAQTHFTCERTNGWISELRVEPKTGRTHQIRVHLASIGHPVVGDETYGGGSEWLKRVAPLQRTSALGLVQSVTRTLLHAEKLEFKHPVNRRRMVFTAPCPKDFGAAFKWLK